MGRRRSGSCAARPRPRPMERSRWASAPATSDARPRWKILRRSLIHPPRVAEGDFCSGGGPATSGY
eukprot:7288890-Pyramimonas_sp.AAC.1